MKLRWILLSVLFAAALGTGVGFSRAVSQVGLPGSDARAFKARANAKAQNPNIGSIDENAPPKVVVLKDPVTSETNEHDFGGMEKGAYGEHQFRIRNDGKGVLFLEKLQESCSCTVATLDKTEVMPGEIAVVTMGWDTTKKDAGPLRLTVPVKTNDGDQPLLMFGVSGTLTVKYDLVPKELSFGEVTRGEPKTATVRFFGYTQDAAAILKHEFKEAETADQFEWTTRPVPKEELPELATSGLEIAVTSKATLPQGLLRQKIWFTHNLDSSPLEVHLNGNVVGRVRVVGSGWSDLNQTLDLGTTRRGVELVRKAFVIIHAKEGDLPNAVIEKIEPAFLKAELGEGKALGNDRVKQYPLTLTIPADAPLANLRANATGEGLGLVLLKTTLSDAPEMPLRIRLTITE